MKRIVFTACMIVLLIVWMMLIFSFSAQSGEESGGLSAIIAQPVTDLIVRVSGGMSAEARAALYIKVDGYVRIAAHFSEYAILGVLLTLVLRCLGPKMLWLPWLLGTVYAVTDEWHQSFTPNRTSDPMDVVIDSCGVICGVLIFRIFMKVWRRKHVHNQ